MMVLSLCGFFANLDRETLAPNWETIISVLSPRPMSSFYSSTTAMFTSQRLFHRLNDISENKDPVCTYHYRFLRAHLQAKSRDLFDRCNMTSDPFNVITREIGGS